MAKSRRLFSIWKVLNEKYKNAKNATYVYALRSRRKSLTSFEEIVMIIFISLTSNTKQIAAIIFYNRSNEFR